MRAQSAREVAEFGLNLPLDMPVRDLGVAGNEPTARLAPYEHERLFDTMRRLAASRVGIIYISHLLEALVKANEEIIATGFASPKVRV
jgi:hypothetical protein